MDLSNNARFPEYFAKESRDNSAYQIVALEKSYRMDHDRLGPGGFSGLNSREIGAKSSFWRT